MATTLDPLQLDAPEWQQGLPGPELFLCGDALDWTQIDLHH
ncbi:hypothetical protein SynBIOSE41_01726 [Synechococcus sp. BIOS-E4-1]|nr:hypothetical protein SynBIOSE41_01726 [Synechococcus sp. BIOS-E4-1]